MKIHSTFNPITSLWRHIHTNGVSILSPVENVAEINRPCALSKALLLKEAWQIVQDTSPEGEKIFDDAETSLYSAMNFLLNNIAVV